MGGAESPWYRDGLRFGCTGCGSCCRGEGYVWVDAERADTIAEYLGVPLEEFARRFLRQVGDRFSLIEKPNQDCIFWGGGCSIYPVRPRQCRTFPFWKGCLSGPEAWEKTASDCAGVGKGRLYSAAEIDRLAEGEGATRRGPGAEEGSGDCCSGSGS